MTPTDGAAAPQTAVRSRAGVTLVTGATGYIGGQLVPLLLQRGHRVRVLARSPGRVADRPWAEQVEVVGGDLSDERDLDTALAGADVAYYLVHSMDGTGDFVARDRALAEGFAAAARRAGTRRIVYLSGLHPVDSAEDPELSAHLGSRVEVGQILLDSGVPTAVLQAGVVLGAGSASFDMLRHLTERLPVMVAPRWLDNRIQPIAVDDVLHYLAGAADLPREVTRTFDVAGPDVLTYREMIQRYARLVGLGRRAILVLPVLTPGLASHWVGAVTPVSAGIARPLVGSLVHEAVAHEDDIVTLVGEPPGGRTGFDEAIRRAISAVDPTRWRRTALGVAAATAACAVGGSILSAPDNPWYRGLRKPPWQPPPVAFPVVWTSLYLAMGTAATATIAELEEVDRSADARSFRRAYATNLVLNAAWSGLFFRARNLRLATAGAGVLALSSADLARRAGPRGGARKVALGSYAAWSMFATALSAEIERRNR
jgi:uncharacterized protein YbjT (DUF2867 family)/tryptophan-rich sensory protein